MSNVVPFQASALPAAILNAFDTGAADELAAGISASFPVVSFRGRVWRIKTKGEEIIVKDAEGSPKPYIDVVLLAANAVLSKIFYDKNYVEGDDSPPRCWSVDGVKPDSLVESPVSTTCAACPNNVWGSKITPQGSKVKACSDSKRVACVPAADVENEAAGGPMLLRIPAASLQGLLQYSALLKAQGAPFFGVVTRLSFDVDASYPKLECKVIKPITEEQAAVVLKWRSSDEVKRILNTMDDAAAGEPEPVVELASAPPASAQVSEPEAPTTFVDKDGTKFDPDTHASSEGEPVYKADGTFRKKPGRRVPKETVSIEEPAATPPESSPAAPAAADQAEASVAPVDVDAILGDMLSTS